MMIEFWWKVFLLSIVTAAVSKFFGCPAHIVGIFLLAFGGWTVLFLLAIFVGDRLGKRQ